MAQSSASFPPASEASLRKLCDEQQRQLQQRGELLRQYKETLDKHVAQREEIERDRAHLTAMMNNISHGRAADGNGTLQELERLRQRAEHNERFVAELQQRAAHLERDNARLMELIETMTAAETSGAQRRSSGRQATDSFRSALTELQRELGRLRVDYLSEAEQRHRAETDSAALVPVPDAVKCRVKWQMSCKGPIGPTHAS